MLVSKALLKNTPLPVRYEEACRALAECSTIMDAKYFADKAEALAAWAKIYKSDQAEVEARRLKLHAYRKMGLLAQELRPGSRGRRGLIGTVGGPQALLKESGLKAHQGQNALRLARVSNEKFEAISSLPRPPGIAQAAGAYGRGLGSKKCTSQEYYTLCVRTGYGIKACKSIIKTIDPKNVTLPSEFSEITSALDSVRECIEGLNILEQRLEYALSVAHKTQ